MCNRLFYIAQLLKTTELLFEVSINISLIPMSLVMKQRAWRCTGVASRSLALCVSHNNITGVLINRNNCWSNNAARKAIRALSTARLMTVSPKRMDHNIYYQISARYWVIRVSPTIIQLSVNRLCISHVASYDIILWIYAFIL